MEEKFVEIFVLLKFAIKFSSWPCRASFWVEKFEVHFWQWSEKFAHFPLLTKARCKTSVIWRTCNLQIPSYSRFSSSWQLVFISLTQLN